MNCNCNARWSGVDDKMYSDFGCPECTCDKGVKVKSLQQKRDELADQLASDCFPMSFHQQERSSAIYIARTSFEAAIKAISEMGGDVKQWWIDSIYIWEKPYCQYAYNNLQDAEEKSRGVTTHVVEHSALLAAQAKIAELEAEIATLKGFKG